MSFRMSRCILLICRGPAKYRVRLMIDSSSLTLERQRTPLLLLLYFSSRDFVRNSIARYFSFVTTTSFVFVLNVRHFFSDIAIF